MWDTVGWIETGLLATPMRQNNLSMPQTACGRITYQWHAPNSMCVGRLKACCSVRGPK